MRTLVVLVALVGTATGVAVLGRRALPARRLVVLACATVACYVVLTGFLGAGELLVSPGPAGAAMLVTALLVPLVALAAVARLAPRAAPAVLASCAACLVLLAVLGLGRGAGDTDPSVYLAGSWALAGGGAVLGLRAPRPAGSLLVLAALVPAAAWVALGAGQASSPAIAVLLVVPAPVALSGVALIVGGGRPGLLAAGTAGTPPGVTRAGSRGARRRGGAT